MDNVSGRCACFARTLERRAALKVCLGIALGLKFVRAAVVAAADPKDARPQDGDRLVFAGGERAGQVITVADLRSGGGRGGREGRSRWAPDSLKKRNET